MCQSKADGGQRCYGHASAALDRATHRLDLARASGDATAVAVAEARVEEHAITLASTPEGHDRIGQWADQAALTHDYSREAHLRDIARRGQTLRTVNAAAHAAKARSASLHTDTARSTRLLHRMTTAATPEERTYAWTVLSRIPLPAWTAEDRATLAAHLDDVPAGFGTQLAYWKQLRDHGKAHPEEQAALREPLFRYRQRHEARLYPENQPNHRRR